MLVRHDVDRPAWASSASSESGSLELLLTLDALVGAAILRRTNGCSSTARARCAAQPPLSRAHAHTSRGCARQGCGVMRRRAGPASLHPRPTIHGAAPCTAGYVLLRGWRPVSEVGPRSDLFFSVFANLELFGHFQLHSGYSSIVRSLAASILSRRRLLHAYVHRSPLRSHLATVVHSPVDKFKPS